ncbi:TetR/AcrR family transcriptional regulator [Streptomyces sp. NPDC059063]|uniref:TetR/AcrR family transcriptional regulator n=1 Tax=unclassified Streptomyces TaxID=2593676 RepID=UPI003682AC6F
MSRDTAATRARLIAAARVEFARRGIDGARVDRIAREAGASKERIYGHFGSKEGLFEAAVAEALEEHTAALGLPSGDIGEYVGRVYDMHRENPQLLRLLLWEALYYGDAPLPDEGERVGHYARKTEALAGLLGMEAGRPAALVLLATIGLAAWPLAVPQLTRTVVPGAGQEQVDGGAGTVEGDEIRDFLVRFAQQALPLAGKDGARGSWHSRS